MTGWVQADEAAVLLGTTVGNVHVIAHRRHWPRRKTGRVTRYPIDRVLAEKETRDTR